MPLDPQAAAFLQMLAASNAPPLNTQTPEQAREAIAGFIALAGEGEPVAAVENRSIPGPAGEIPVRIYTPSGQPPFPALVYYHGGGWVVGNLDMVDTVCRALANRAGSVVVSVDYRLAPEHKFPASAEDAYAAAHWVATNASTIGVDPGRIAVGGDSAGGNLAAVVSLIARDRGSPSLAYQVLVYPVTDYAFDTPSYQANGKDYFLTTEMMEWFWNHYLRTPEDGNNPYASPLRATNLAGLPPALVITAEYDPLRDEGERYAQRLREAGVPVRQTRYDGMVHGFFTMPGTFDKAKQAVDEIAEELRKTAAARA